MDALSKILNTLISSSALAKLKTESNNMALNINPTPVLKGKEAARFLTEIKTAKKKIDFSSEIKNAKSILAKSKKVASEH